MSIYFVDSAPGVKDYKTFERYKVTGAGPSDILEWNGYKEFKNQVLGTTLSGKILGALRIKKYDRYRLQQCHHTVNELCEGLENLVKEGRIDRELYLFHMDVVLYKGFRAPLIAMLTYYLGVDVTILGQDNIKIARGVATSHGLTFIPWRLAHVSFLQNIQKVEGPQKILDCILDYNKAITLLD